MVLLMLLSFVGFIGGLIWLIIRYFRKKDTKKPLIFFLASILLFFVSVANLPETDKNNKAEATNETKKQNDDEADYSKANKEINEELLQDLGWALGKLDENGEETENGEANPDFAYAIYVTKIELSEEDGQVNIYVTPEFSQLDDETKQEFIHRAQNKTVLHTKDNERLFTVIFDDNKEIGRSKVSDVSSFKFNK